jgi:hypothetical protein
MNKALQELNPLLSDGWVGASKDYYYRNVNDATALHRLVGQRVRADAVKLFLELHSQSINDNCTKLWHRQLPTSGATALHVALHRCSWGVLEIVQLLLSAATIPMHSTNVYPLHLVCYRYDSILLSEQDKSRLFCMILEAWPKAATERDSNGDMPLQLLFHNDEQRNPRLLVPTALRLAQAAVFCDNNKELTWYHLCSLPRCPPVLMIQLLTLHKDTEIMGLLGDFHGQRDPGGTGRTPLHAAAAAEPSSCSGHTLLRVVLQADPTAVFQRDHQGRLPLHDAVTNPTLTRSAIKSLVRGYPEALAVPDPITGLLPFASLAVNHDDLNAAYDLLRMDPTVCHL